MGMFMNDPLALAKRADEPLYANPKARGRQHAIQRTIPILAVTEDGIFKVASDKFSKSYELQDINYAALTNSEKRPILERWGNLIRSLRCANLKVTIYTGYIDEEEARQKILYPWQKEELKEYTSAYNETIRDAVYNVNQGLEQHIYFTITETAPGLRDARAAFQELEVSLKYALGNLDTGTGGNGSGIRAMTTNERIELLHNFYNLGYDETFRFDVREAYRMKRNFINEIVNEELVEERASFRTEKKFGCAYYIRNFPNSSDDDLIPALSNMPCPSVVTVNIKPVDEDVVRSHLKACYMAVQQRINHSQEEKARHGNFTDVARTFATETSEIEQLLDSSDQKDDRYFFTDVFIVQLADSREELKSLQHSLDILGRSKSVSIRPVLLHQLDAIATALPIGVRYWEHSRCNNTEATASLLPFVYRS